MRGVDLYPPPDTWVPENCKFEVDDLLKRWEFPKLFDLVHIRQSSPSPSGHHLIREQETSLVRLPIGNGMVSIDKLTCMYTLEKAST